MKELVVISGKGGTGKTSIAAALIALMRGRVTAADCDVDAADLHLLLDPQVKSRTTFTAGKRAILDAALCAACGKCADACRFDAIDMTGPPNDIIRKTYRVDTAACEGCGLCARVCPTGAIAMADVPTGESFVSETRFGPMAHARLFAGAENSGKLVTLVRKNARELGKLRGTDYLICDGPPGIGCPVIASISGADMVLVVTEPTVSGIHDFDRVCQLTSHFGVRTAVCINKSDINGQVASEIERYAAAHGVPVLGMVKYDRAFTAAQRAGLTLPEFGGRTADEIGALWSHVQSSLNEPKTV